MSKQFFITGLPRTRTAWLANLFTTGNSFCYHEVVYTNKEVSSAIAALKIDDYEYVGDSSSAIPMYAETLFSEFPDAPIVLIERDTGECLSSFRRAFLYPDGGKVTSDKLEIAASMRPFASDGMERCEKAVKQMFSKYKERIKVVSFYDLDDMKVLEDLWSHCVPDIPFDERRAEQLSRLNIQLDAGKYTLIPEGVM